MISLPTAGVTMIAFASVAGLLLLVANLASCYSMKCVKEQLYIDCALILECVDHEVHQTAYCAGGYYLNIVKT